MDRPLSLRALAKASGFSLSTVSLALRDAPRIPAETRKVIQELAAKSGYRPNARVAAAMRQIRRPASQRSYDTVAWLYKPYRPDHYPRHDYLKTFFEAGKARAEKLGWHIQRFDLSSASVTPKSAPRILFNRGIKAAVIPPLDYMCEDFMSDYSRIAAVPIGYTVVKPDLCRVERSLVDSMSTVFQEITRRGYRRPGFVVFEDENLRAHRHPWAGFLVMREELPISNRVPVLALKSYETFREEPVLAWARKHKPDVVIGGGRLILEALLHGSIKVPEEMGFVLMTRTEDDAEISGLDPNYGAMAEAAVELSIQMAQHEDFGAPEILRTVLVASTWREGSTLREVR